MTAEAMNRRLAVWMGWRQVDMLVKKPSRIGRAYNVKELRWLPDDLKGVPRVMPPDYANSRDAVAEVEARLTPEQRKEYGLLLTDHFTEEFCELAGTAEHVYACATLTGPQRCESLCRTLGLWEEDV